MQLKVKRLDKGMPMPVYAKSGDAGFDLRATEDVTIYPGETVMVGTGLAFEIPEGWNGEGRYDVKCHRCHRPMKVDVEIELYATARKDEAYIKAERDKYEKRMAGDWS